MIELLEQLEFWHWFVFGGALLILEMVISGTFFLWMGISSCVVGITAWAFSDLPWTGQLIIFGILAVVFILGWIAYQKKSPIETDDKALNRRGEQYINRTFTLEQPIVNGVGKIHVDDTSWKIIGDDMDTGSQVVVTGVNGTSLTIKLSE